MYSKIHRNCDSIMQNSRYDYVKRHVSFTDVDECAQGTHDCLADLATCTNTFGFYSCACNDGLKGDGKTSCKQGRYH